MQVINNYNNNFRKTNGKKMCRNLPSNLTDKTLIKISPVGIDDDSFLNAYNENMRLDAISSEKKMKLIKFENDLKQRLKAYKKINQQINHDSTIKIEDSNELKTFNRNKKFVKIDLIETKLKGVKIDEKHEQISSSSSSIISNDRPSSGSSCSSNHLLVQPNKFLIRSLKSEKQNLENQKIEIKKRIAQTRKSYGNLEREKAKEVKLFMNENREDSPRVSH